MFCTFWDSFQSSVDNNLDLTPIDKFNYLYSLLEGPGLQAIQGLTITDKNYKSAVEILHNRFGKIPVIMSKLTSDVRIQIVQNTTKDVWDIRELLDVIQKEVEAREVCENIKTHSDYQNKKPNAPVP